MNRQRAYNTITNKNRGACDYRLRGSYRTSTLEPDVGNAAVGKQICRFTGGNHRWFSLFFMNKAPFMHFLPWVSICVTGLADTVCEYLLAFAVFSPPGSLWCCHALPPFRKNALPAYLWNALKVMITIVSGIILVFKIPHKFLRNRIN